MESSPWEKRELRNNDGRTNSMLIRNVVEIGEVKV